MPRIRNRRLHWLSKDCRVEDCGAERRLVRFGGGLPQTVLCEATGDAHIPFIVLPSALLQINMETVSAFVPL